MGRNVARDLIWPSDPNVLVRVVFLYVGQGSSTLILAADGTGSYRSLLLDINLDVSNGGINVPRMMSDLLGDAGLDVFANSHPHDDHLRGVSKLAEAVEINEIWHSGHKPGKQHDDCYKELMNVVQALKDKGRTELILEGSRNAAPFGQAYYHVLAPAEYVSDYIGEEDPETRYARIHEQCGVLKFGIKDAWILIPGDAGRSAFEKYMTKYHGERLAALVLAASHHGSRTFFKHQDEDEEPYLDALRAIAPEYVVVSAPKRSESKHGHPHQDAVELYAAQVGKDNVLHTGEKRYSFICDIYRDGSYSGIQDDKGVLAREYAFEDGDNGGGGKKETSAAPAIIVGTRIDDRPMG
jgi:beta-lactamase superfamily II metal-dependent hydrolase